MGWHSGEDKWGRLAGRVYPISWAAQGIRQMKSVLRRPGSQGHRNWIHGVHPSTASRVKGFSFVRMIFMVCCEGSGHGWLRTLEKPCKHSGCCSEASVFQMKVSWLSRGVAKDLHGSRWWLDCLDDRDSCLCVICWSSYATVCVSWAHSMLPDDGRAAGCLPCMNAVRLLCSSIHSWEDV